MSGPSLFMGLGSFIWIPLSLAVGRRTVFLLANLLMLASTIWAGFSGGFYQLLIAVSLQGISEGISISAVSSSLSIRNKSNIQVKVLLMVIDLTFIHQRPQAIAMVWTLVGATNMSILSLVPQMTQNTTKWRLFYDIWIIPIAISCLVAFFFFPETYFLRPAVAFDGRILLQSATEKVQIYPDWEAAAMEKNLPDTPQSGWKLKIRELKFWGMNDGGWSAMRHCYVQILLCFVNPLVFWVMVLNSLVFAGMISIGITYTSVLTAPPYNMPANLISLVNLAGAVGSFMAWPVCGLLTSSIIRRLAMRNGGVREAEFYLPAFILPVFVTAASLILYGFTVQYQHHFILIYISYALNAFGFVSAATANTIWVTEAFPRHAAAALTVVVGGSYSASFGMSYAILPWIESQGRANAELELAIMIIFVGCIGIPVAFWGKKVRQSIGGKSAGNESGALRPQ